MQIDLSMKLKERIILLAFIGCSILVFYKFKARDNDISPLIDDHEQQTNHIVLDGTHLHKRGVKLEKTDEEKHLELMPIPEAKEKTDVDDIKNDHYISSDMDPWDIWWTMIDRRHVTSPDNENQVKSILKALATRPIVEADVGSRGTQLKASLKLAGASSQKVVFKPMRYSRDHIIEGNIYDGFDRHNAEIAAFHLDRILGFYRAPPVVGRKVNLAKEMKPVTKKKLLKTFFTDEKNNTCFFGVCYYCKKAEAACADGNIMEGSVTIWLSDDWQLANNRHPWQRTYHKKKKAKWENDPNYCKNVLTQAPYDSGPRLLDIMDTSVFDFLIGNGDRHHYETFKKDGSHGLLLHLDNAKSFGNPHHDEMSILSPLSQCCRIRQSTYDRLQRIASESSNSLSSKLNKSLKFDPVFPILTEPHLLAVDRRLETVLDVVKKCVEENGIEKVVIKDEF